MTPQQKVFIIENRLTMTNRKMAYELDLHRTKITDYLRKHEIRAPEEVINKRRSDAVNKVKDIKREARKEVTVKKAFDNSIDYAKSLGYNNVSEAFKHLGRSTFMDQFRSSSYNH